VLARAARQEGETSFFLFDGSRFISLIGITVCPSPSIYHERFGLGEKAVWNGCIITFTFHRSYAQLEFDASRIDFSLECLSGSLQVISICSLFVYARVTLPRRTRLSIGVICLAPLRLDLNRDETIAHSDNEASSWEQ